MSEADPGVPVPPEAARALTELQQLIGFHVSLANTAIRAHFQEHFWDLGLTQKQIAILWLVEGCPGIIQVDLAHMLHVKRAAMSGMVAGLCARGLMVRGGPGNGDARHVPLTLTGAGRRTLRKGRRAIDRHEAWVKQHFTGAEQQAIAVLMTKLHKGPG